MSNENTSEKVYSVKSILIQNSLGNEDNISETLLSHTEKDLYVDSEGGYDVEEIVRFDKTESSIVENYLLEFASIYDILDELPKTIRVKGSTILIKKEVKFMT